MEQPLSAHVDAHKPGLRLIAGRKPKLLAGPFHQPNVQLVHHGRLFSWTVAPEVVELTPKVRSQGLGYLTQPQILPRMEAKLPKRGIDPLKALGADAWPHPPEALTIHLADHVARLEREAKEVELVMDLHPARGLDGKHRTIDNSCLFFAQGKSELPQPRTNLLKKESTAFQTRDMDHDVVRIPLKADFRMACAHPEVEGLVQVQVGKQGADDTALRRAHPPLHKLTIGLHRGGQKPATAVQEHVPLLSVAPQNLKPPLMVDLIEERTDVQIDHVPAPTDPLHAHCQGIMRVAAGTVPVRILMEPRLHVRFKAGADRLLRHPVKHRGNAKLAFLAASLGNAPLTNRRGHVAPAG